MDVEEKEGEEGGRLLEQTDRQIHTVPTNLPPAAKSLPAIIFSRLFLHSSP